MYDSPPVGKLGDTGEVCGDGILAFRCVFMGGSRGWKELCSAWLRAVGVDAGGGENDCGKYPGERRPCSLDICDGGGG